MLAARSALSTKYVIKSKVGSTRVKNPGRLSAVLWHVENTSLYLRASIHMLEQTRHGLFPEAEQVYKKVQRVTFEHDIGAPPNPVFIENIPGSPLSTQVPQAVFASAARE